MTDRIQQFDFVFHPEPPEWRADDRAELVAPGIARFRDPRDAPEPLPPSFGLQRELAPLGAIPDAFRTRPTFAGAATRDGRPLRLVRIDIDPGTSLYGGGEVTGPLLRGGPDSRRIVCWNTDVFEYDGRDEVLYQSHPFVLAVRADGSAFGVLFDTTFRCAIDLRDGVRFGAEGLPHAVYIIEASSPREAVSALAGLIGPTPMPPRWALGYHQCRWSYEPEQRVLRLADEFRARRIPCDCLWLDIDYMDGFRCFTFDRAKFPDPRALNDRLHGLGFKSVWMIDPGIKADPAYPVYRSGRDGDHFIRDAGGAEFRGQVWPGACAFPDFTREPTRRWWAGLYRDFMANGIDGVWNDMNEPAVLDFPFKQMPETCRHRADPKLGGPDTHARYHNVYGMLMARATREGALAANPDRRPFVLTRSNFIGGSRYAATWTGDNTSDWMHLAWSIPMALNLGICGQPFAGPDIGGFAGDCTGLLYARWMGIGALLPFARAHSVKDSSDHEPWSFGPQVEHACRLALERRYRLLPYLYTLFREAHIRGLPVVRPLFFADPADPRLRDAEDSFLLGADLLVRADVTESRAGCRSPMPTGDWRPFEPASETDPDLPALLLRQGAIIPTGPSLQHTGEHPLDPLTLVLAPDAAGNASGTLYEDAGEGHAHESGEYLLTTYASRREGDSLIVETSRAEGRMPRPSRALQAIALLPGGATLRAAGRDGRPLRLSPAAPDA